MSISMEDVTTTVIKALADPMRIAMVRSLAKQSKPSRSCDIVEDCSSCGTLSQPAISHHFKKLADAGIIHVQKAGSEKLYLLNKEKLLSIGIDANKL